MATMAEGLEDQRIQSAASDWLLWDKVREKEGRKEPGVRGRGRPTRSLYSGRLSEMRELPGGEGTPRGHPAQPPRAAGMKAARSNHRMVEVEGNPCGHPAQPPALQERMCK